MWSDSLISSITDIRIDFGTRQDPIGGRDREEWEMLRPRWRQVHGVGVAGVSGPAQECGEVDALWTDQPGQPIGVVTADCVPILLWRQDLQAVGAIHAGWRGTLARIPEAFFKALPPRYSEPSEWSAILGPSIRACCYEVSPELIRQFGVEFPTISPGTLEPAHRKLDLIAVNKSMLLQAGIQQVEVHPDCTYCTRRTGEKSFDPLYSSYRRGDRDSRQISIISLGPRV